MVITLEVHFILYAKLLFPAREIEQLTSQLNALVLVYVSIGKCTARVQNQTSKISKTIPNSIVCGGGGNKRDREDRAFM